MTYNTEQRNLLLAFFKSSPDTMFSASQIAAALEQNKISRSAVYRNLAALEQEGKIRRYTKEQSREAFFQFYDVQSCREHIHMSCTECGKIFHMENKIAQNLIEKLENTEGFEICKEKTTLYGICKECAENK
jgi:Fur family ferric uptake transcriptional regulator